MPSNSIERKKFIGLRAGSLSARILPTLATKPNCSVVPSELRNAEGDGFQYGWLGDCLSLRAWFSRFFVHSLLRGEVFGNSSIPYPSRLAPAQFVDTIFIRTTLGESVLGESRNTHPAIRFSAVFVSRTPTNSSPRCPTR